MQKFYKLNVYFFLLFVLVNCAQAPQLKEVGNSNNDKVVQPNEEVMKVYKNTFCFCCKRWMDHLQKNDFDVISDNSKAVAEVKKRWGIPYGMQGCHTGVFDNSYVFEGHVPARLVRKFLSDPPPNSIGLAVPGMPALSPGMYEEGSANNKQATPYPVYLILADGQYRFYETVNQPE